MIECVAGLTCNSKLATAIVFLAAPWSYVLDLLSLRLDLQFESI